MCKYILDNIFLCLFIPFKHKNFDINLDFNKLYIIIESQNSKYKMLTHITLMQYYSKYIDVIMNRLIILTKLWIKIKHKKYFQEILYLLSICRYPLIHEKIKQKNNKISIVLNNIDNLTCFFTPFIQTNEILKYISEILSNKYVRIKNVINFTDNLSTNSSIFQLTIKEYNNICRQWMDLLLIPDPNNVKHTNVFKQFFEIMTKEYNLKLIDIHNMSTNNYITIYRIYLTHQYLNIIFKYFANYYVQNKQHILDQKNFNLIQKMGVTIFRIELV